MHQSSAVQAPNPRAPSEAAAPPVGIVAGLALMAGAFGLDLVAHAAALMPLEPVAHVAGVLGMAITWLAVVVDGTAGRARR